MTHHVDTQNTKIENHSEVDDILNSSKQNIESNIQIKDLLEPNVEMYDPRNVINIGEFVSMDEQTKSKYAKTWIAFCDTYGISIDKIPIEADFMDFFKQKKESGTRYGTMKSIYSHLNKACITIYGWQLQKWPKIYAYIKSSNEDILENYSTSMEIKSPDPRNLDNIPEFALIGKDTKQKYAKTWYAFCDSYGISIDKIPQEADFMDYFKQKKGSGTNYRGLQFYNSQLNKVCLILYGWTLKKWPKISNYIKSCKNALHDSKKTHVMASVLGTVSNGMSMTTIFGQKENFYLVSILVLIGILKQLILKQFYFINYS